MTNKKIIGSCLISQLSIKTQRLGTISCKKQFTRWKPGLRIKLDFFLVYIYYKKSRSLFD